MLVFLGVLAASCLLETSPSAQVSGLSLQIYPTAVDGCETRSRSLPYAIITIIIVTVTIIQTL